MVLQPKRRDDAHITSGELRSGKNADRRCGILRCGKPTCTGDEVVGRKLVTDRCRARLEYYNLVASVRRSRLLPQWRPQSPRGFAKWEGEQGCLSLTRPRSPQARRGCRKITAAA